MLQQLKSRRLDLSDEEHSAIYKALAERDAILGNREGYQVGQVPRISPLRHVGALYLVRWTDSFSEAEARWQNAFVKLNTSRSYSARDFIVPSGETFLVAENILRWLKETGLLNAPEVTMDGDGNLYLEWQENSRRISICLSGQTTSSYIYLGRNTGYAAFPLTQHNLTRAIASYSHS